VNVSEPRTAERRRLILVGSRLAAYREYALKTLAESYEVVLVVPDWPTWQAKYVQVHRIADTTDPAALFAAVADLRGEVADAAIVTWDEFSLVATATVARRLRMRHLSSQAARLCRDKYAARLAYSEAGLPTVEYGLAAGVREALELADRIGYPVVVKPRSLGGSLGVSIVRDPHEMPAAIDTAVGSAGLIGADAGGGVLVEEYLPGPEISVDCLVRGGVPEVVFVARKQLGVPPYFEETGHRIVAWRHEPWAGEMTDLITAAHRALGVDWGPTHTEVRLTQKGPRIVELNGRLGGDLIPLLGQLATGVDLVGAVAAQAFEDEPVLVADRDLVAEIRFLYPPTAGVVRAVELPRPDAVPGLVDAVCLAEPGSRLELPPAALTPRTVALIAVGADASATRRTLDDAEGLVRLDLESAGSDRLGALVENPVTRRFMSVDRDPAELTVSGVRGDEWFRYGAGGGEALNRPVFLTSQECQQFTADLSALFDLLCSLPDRLFGGDRRAFAQAVGMNGAQADLVLRGAGPRVLPLARADMYRETNGFRLMELNTGSSLGGWQMGTFARAMMNDTRFQDFARGEGLTFPDPLAKICAVLREAHPALKAIDRPLLALTDWPDGYDKTKCWMDFVVPSFGELGFDAVVCHLEQFTYLDGRVQLDGRQVDVVYRMFLPGEMADDQRSYDLVEPLLDAVERETVVMFAPLDSELYGNKGSLAMLSDERNAERFTAEELELISRILPWTRFVVDEKVTAEDGTTVDLLNYCIEHQQDLVLKPTLLYGGVGVIPGWTVDAQDWRERVLGAVNQPFVIQRRLQPTTERFVTDDGNTVSPMAVAYGVLIIGNTYAGTLARGVWDSSVGIVSMRDGAQIGCAFHVDGA
jgi:biotin carboxylase